MPDTDNAVAVGFAVQAALASRIQTNSIAPALLAMYEAGRGAARMDLHAVSVKEMEGVRSAFPAFWEVYAAITGEHNGRSAEELYKVLAAEQRHAIDRMRSMFTMGYLEAIAVAR